MGGYGLNTVALVSGYRFNVSVGLEDLWSAGPLPRWSNADGLTGPNRFATGSDESGQAEGTLIGRDFGARQQGNLIAPYGSLVGQIGNGEFFLMLSGMGLIRFMTRRQRV